MKRQATYRPPFNCWRLPSVKDKNKKDRKRRQPPALASTHAEATHRPAPLETAPTTIDLHLAPVTKRAAQRRIAIDLANRLPISPICASSDPFGSLTGEGNSTLENVGRWWFYRHADTSVSPQYDPASVYWVDAVWNFARSDEIMFTCVVAFAASKMSKLTGIDNEYTELLTKGRILQLVKERLYRSPESVSDGMIFVTMTCLALMEMRDGDFPTARKHLLALQRLIQFDYLDGRQWLYVVWVDLRFSLMLGKAPLLPFHIPPDFRSTAVECLPYRAEAQRLALHNAKAIPISPHTSFDVIFANFRKLHELSLAWEELMVSQTPPFGQVYDLDYATLSSHVVLVKAKPGASVDSTLADELVLGAVQLHVWIISRYWVPQKRITYASVLKRINALLANHAHDIVDRWCSKFGDLTSLLWILFTFTGVAHEFARDLEPLGVRLLARTVTELDLKREINLTRILQQWPWIARWHGSKLTTLWALISTELTGDIAKEQKCPNSGLVAASPTPSSPDHYYIGGFEFCAG